MYLKATNRSCKRVNFQLFPSGMTGSDLELTPFTRAVFRCKENVVTVEVKFKGESVGPRLSFTRAEAERIGNDISATGEFADFPLPELPTEAVRRFGERLKKFGAQGN
jgi:hypothetical protein